MRRSIALAVLMMIALDATAATKDSGTTTLKDVQPAGSTSKKHKHQQYDLIFVTPAGTDYTCRTQEKSSVNATDIVVGTNITYEVKGNKGKVKTAAGKQYNCTVMRAAKVSTAAQ